MIYYLLINSLVDDNGWKNAYKRLRKNNVDLMWEDQLSTGDVVPCIDGFLSKDKEDLRGFGIDIGEIVSNISSHYRVFDEYRVELILTDVEYVNDARYLDKVRRKLTSYNQTHDYIKFKLVDGYNSTETEMGEKTDTKFTLTLEVGFFTIFTEIMRTHEKGITDRINSVIKKILG